MLFFHLRKEGEYIHQGFSFLQDEYTPLAVYLRLGDYIFAFRVNSHGKVFLWYTSPTNPRRVNPRTEW